MIAQLRIVVDNHEVSQLSDRIFAAISRNYWHHPVTLNRHADRRALDTWVLIIISCGVSVLRFRLEYLVH